MGEDLKIVRYVSPEAISCCLLPGTRRLTILTSLTLSIERDGRREAGTSQTKDFIDDSFVTLEKPDVSIFYCSPNKTI